MLVISSDYCTKPNCCTYQLYFLLFVSVTLQCTRDGQFVLVVARDATMPRINLESIHMLEDDPAHCAPVDSTASFAIYQFAVSTCGTTMKVGNSFISQLLVASLFYGLLFALLFSFRKKVDLLFMRTLCPLCMKRVWNLADQLWETMFMSEFGLTNTGRICDFVEYCDNISCDVSFPWRFLFVFWKKKKFINAMVILK